MGTNRSAVGARFPDRRFRGSCRRPGRSASRRLLAHVDCSRIADDRLGRATFRDRTNESGLTKIGDFLRPHAKTLALALIAVLWRRSVVMLGHVPITGGFRVPHARASQSVVRDTVGSFLWSSSTRICGIAPSTSRIDARPKRIASFPGPGNLSRSMCASCVNLSRRFGLLLSRDTTASATVDVGIGCSPAPRCCSASTRDISQNSVLSRAGRTLSCSGVVVAELSGST
jgi:hypothetical protein